MKENQIGFWEAIGDIVATTAVAMYGKDKVQKIVKYKPSAARQEIDVLVNEVVTSQNRALMAAALDEFGNQFQAAETREVQDEINKLFLRNGAWPK